MRGRKDIGEGDKVRAEGRHRAQAGARKKGVEEGEKCRVQIVNGRSVFVLSARHEKIFLGYIRKWAQRLGLNRYEIVFAGLSDEDPGARAWVHVHTTGCIATICLGRLWDCRPTRLSLEKTAFHECCEILLHDVWNLASRAASQEEVESATHGVIRGLESLFFGIRKQEFADDYEE